MQKLKITELQKYFIIGIVIFTVFLTDIVEFMIAGEVMILSNLFYFPLIFAIFQYPSRGIVLSTIVALTFFGIGGIYVAADPILIIPSTMQFFEFVGVGVVVSSLASDLQFNEAKYRSIFDNSGSGISIVERKTGKIVEANAPFHEMIGSSAEKVTERLWKDPMDWHAFAARVQAAGSVADEELLTGGDDPHALLVSAGIASEDRIVLTISDLSQQKWTEYLLRKNVENLTFLSETATDFVRSDPSTDLYAYIAKKLHQLSPEAMVFLSTYDPAGSTLTVRAVAGPDAAIGTIRTLISRDPVGLHFSVPSSAVSTISSGSLEEIADGIPGISFGQIDPGLSSKAEQALNIGSSHGIGFVWKDVLFGTAVLLFPRGAVPSDSHVIELFARQASIALQQQHAEMALRESERRLNLAMEGANLGVWDTNLETEEAIFSENWTRMLGYDPGEIDSQVKGWVRLIHPDDLESVMNVRRDHIRGALPIYETEFRLRAKDGTWRWIHSRGRITDRDPDGKPLRMTGVQFDVTERRQYRQALEDANKKLRLLSSITRHDFLNQITAILGYTELLEMDDLSPEERREYTGRIKKVVNITTDLVRFTKDYQEVGMAAPRWHRVSDEVAQAEAEVCPDTVHVADQCGDLEVYADPMLYKVIYNLLENAVRHGKHVTEIRVHFTRNENGGVLVFEDNGAGIPEREKSRIFDKGFGKNTGYGLFLVKEILGITGISITETGRKGEGARFELAIPGEYYRIPE
jgi:PAS domain S-box-containing protein